MSYGPDITKWDHRRRFEELHREKGLCIKCCKPAEKGRAMCKIHREAHNAMQNTRRKQKRAEGLCTICGRPMHDDDGNRLIHNRNNCIPSRRVQL